MACVYEYEGKTYDRDEFTKILLNMKPSEASKYIPGVRTAIESPFIDKTGKYVLLATKKLVRMAAENNYEMIVFDTGEMNADRYDLSKQVDSIHYINLGDGRYAIKAVKGGSEVIHKDVAENEIEDIVGKDIAEKIVNNQGEESDQFVPKEEWKMLSGVDLKVGGEGMKGFYDSILPKSINKFFNKKAWGKARVELNGVEVPGKFKKAKRGERQKIQIGEPAGIKLHSLEITPEMKSKALTQGMPLFATKERTNTNSKAFKKWFGKSKVVDKNGAPLVVYHGTDSEFEIFNTTEGVFYFTEDKKSAMGYGENIMDSYLSLQNPKIIDYKGADDSSVYEDSKQAKKDGNDGLIILNSFDGVEIINQYIAFKPTQIKSVYNQGTWDANNPNRRYQTIEDFVKKIDKKDKPQKIKGTASEQVFASKDTLKEKISDLFSKAKSEEERTIAKDRVIANTLDKLHFVKQRLGDRTYRIHRGLTGIQTASFPMFLEHGKLKWDGDVLTSDTRNEGVLPFLKSIGDDWQDLLKWTTAMRAEELDKQGRENLITKDLRDQIFEEVGETSKSGVKWSELNKKLQEFNKSILDVAEEAGLINKQGRSEWEQDFYIPFYRIFEDELTKQEFLSGPRKSLQHITSQIKRLQGGVNKIGDPLENLMKNWMHMLDASARNKARNVAYTVGKELNIIETVEKKDLVNVLGSVTETRYAVVKNGATRATRLFDTKEEAANFIEDNKNYKIEQRKTQKIKFGSMKDLGVLSFQKDGKPVYFKTEDNDLFNALLETNPDLFNNVLMKLMGKAKRVLSYTATFGPAFKIRNLIRDTVHVAVVSKNFVPFVDSAKGFVKSMREDKDYIEFMASGFGFGSSYVNASDPESAAIFAKKLIKTEGKGVLNRILDTPKKILDVWEKIGSASENAARVALYTNLKEKGVSNLDAGFEARDLMDFSMSGGGTTTQLLIRTIPFLNARVQALYKLGRAASYDPKSFFVKAGMLTFASLALWSISKDDDRYKELPDWDKWTYYHFWVGDLHYRIPKPFEIGALFSSLPETIANVQNGTEEGKNIWDWFRFTASDVFSMDMPQLFKPLVEESFNKNTFTGQSIVPNYMEQLEPSEQYNPWTPATARMIGEKLGVSPLRVEHLIRGYFATVGMGMLSGMDIISREAMGYPDAPKRIIDDYGLGFVKRGAPVRSTKYISSFYELYREMDSLNKTVNHYKKTKQHAKIKDIMSDRKKKRLLSMKGPYNKINKRMSLINNKIKTIYRSEKSPSEKRQLIDSLTKKRNLLAEKAAMIMKNRLKN